MKNITRMLATLLLIALLASLCEAKTSLPNLFNANSIFQYGFVSTTQIPVEKSNSTKFEMLIVSPTVRGKYAVIQFHHGFQMNSSDYSRLFHFICSHGYIIVAPQLYPVDSFLPSSGPEELNDAAKVANWLLTGLSLKLPKGVNADLSNVIVSGHGRGGKVAFALALGKAETRLNVQFSSLFGIDPVEGIDPNIITKKGNSFNLRIPVGIIGTGQGPKWNIKPPFLPCAPAGRNHKDFFNDCIAPCEHFVVTDYGHMDMLNDKISGFTANGLNVGCKSTDGPVRNKELVRRTVGGIFVSFLKAHLYKNWNNYYKIIADPANVAPVALDDPVEIKALKEAFEI